MGSTLVPVTLAILVAAGGALGASPCSAQTQLTSVEALRRELAAGDLVTIVPATGQAVAGRLTRVGPGEIEVRTSRDRNPRDVTIALDAIRSLDRPRDPTRNGAMIGAGVGAGFGAAMFVQALAVDRNEADEWAGVFAGAAAVSTGIGALIGWAIDKAHSKPPIRFDATSGGKTHATVRPQLSRRRGVAVAVSLSR